MFEGVDGGVLSTIDIDISPFLLPFLLFFFLKVNLLDFNQKQSSDLFKDKLISSSQFMSRSFYSQMTYSRFVWANTDWEVHICQE